MRGCAVFSPKGGVSSSSVNSTTHDPVGIISGRAAKKNDEIPDYNQIRHVTVEGSSTERWQCEKKKQVKVGNISKAAILWCLEGKKIAEGGWVKKKKGKAMARFQRRVETVMKRENGKSKAALWLSIIVLVIAITNSASAARGRENFAIWSAK